MLFTQIHVIQNGHAKKFKNYHTAIIKIQTFSINVQKIQTFEQYKTLETGMSKTRLLFNPRKAIIQLSKFKLLIVENFKNLYKRFKLLHS